MSIKSQGPTTFPVDKPCTVFSILSGFVELSQPASTRDVSILLETLDQGGNKGVPFKGGGNSSGIYPCKRISVIDILEDHKDINLPFSTYLQMVPPMRVRQYSISSSPLRTSGASFSYGQHPRSASPVGTCYTYWRRTEILRCRNLRSSHVLHPATDLPSSSGLQRGLPPPERPLCARHHVCAGSGLARSGRSSKNVRRRKHRAGRWEDDLVLWLPRAGRGLPVLRNGLEGVGESGVVDVRPAFSRANTRRALGANMSKSEFSFFLSCRVNPVLNSVGSLVV